MSTSLTMLEVEMRLEQIGRENAEIQFDVFYETYWFPAARYRLWELAHFARNGIIVDIRPIDLAGQPPYHTIVTPK